MAKRGVEYQEKRAALRRATARVLAENPFDAPSGPMVAAAVGMSPSAIPYYYGNLGNLLWSVVSEHLRELLERLGADAPEEMPPRARIVGLAESYCGFAAENAAAHRTMLTHHLRLNAQRSRDARQMQAWVVGVFEDVFAQVLPRADRGRAEVLARSLITLLDGYSEWPETDRNLSPPAFAAFAARMLLSEIPTRRARTRPVAGSSCNVALCAA